MSSHAELQPVPTHPTLVREEPAQWHDDARFSTSMSGRILLALGAFALIAAAALAILGTPTSSLVVIPAILLICITGGFLATGFAIERHGSAALALVLAGPPLVGAYFAALNVIIGEGALLGIALLVAALIPAALAVRGAR